MFYTFYIMDSGEHGLVLTRMNEFRAHLDATRYHLLNQHAKPNNRVTLNVHEAHYTNYGDVRPTYWCVYERMSHRVLRGFHERSLRDFHVRRVSASRTFKCKVLAQFTTMRIDELPNSFGVPGERVKLLG